MLSQNRRANFSRHDHPWLRSRFDREKGVGNGLIPFPTLLAGFVKIRKCSPSKCCRRPGCVISSNVFVSRNCILLAATPRIRLLAITMKTQKINRFRDINIELTNVCNFDCIFCPNDIMTRKKGFMSVDVAKKIIDDLAANKITNLINFYLMGESLLHPDIFKIFEYAFSKDFFIKLNTNASLISEEIAIKLLSHSKLHIFISYHTHSKESFEKYRNSGKISFEEWEENIKKLIEIKSKYNYSAPITILLLKTPSKFSDEIRGNIELVSSNQEAKSVINKWKIYAKKLDGRKNLSTERDDFVSKLIKSPVKRILFFFNRLNYSESIMPGVNITVIKVHSWSNSAKENNERKLRRAIFGSCEALRETISVLWNGDITLCCADYNGDLVQGNIREQAISDYLKSDKAMKIINSFKRNRLPFEKCKECRGASNIANWLFNQIHSSIFYNFPLYRKFRSCLSLDKK